MDDHQEWLMDDEERHLSSDVDYWDRLGSACFDGDAADLIAEEIETAYSRQTDKKVKAMRPPREVPRREKRSGSAADLQHLGEASGFRAPPSSGAGPSVFADEPSGRTAATVEFNPTQVLSITRSALSKLSRTEVPCAADLPKFSESQIRELHQAYRHMLVTLCSSPALGKRYARTARDVDALQIDDTVPEYFANAHGGESIFFRKVLSICGLRNLTHFGSQIYAQLARQLFLGDPSRYRADEGLGLMRRVTGNTVDLDTVVLRCSSHLTLHAINASNQRNGLPTFATTTEFGDSPQAEAIATTCGKVAIAEFAATVRLRSAEQLKARRLDESQMPPTIPVARDNSTRGKFPIWRYVNVGQDSFHANVPVMSDVVGALLFAPLVAIQQYAMLCGGIYGPPPPLSLSTASAANPPQSSEIFAPATLALLEEYFDCCIADSCFNGKWKSIEEYVRLMDTRGSVVDVLTKLQQENQGLFPPSLFDEDDSDHTKEVEVLWGLAQGRSAKDKDAAKGVRLITREDVVALVKSIS